MPISLALLIRVATLSSVNTSDGFGLNLSSRILANNNENSALDIELLGLNVPSGYPSVILFVDNALIKFTAHGASI